MKKNSNSDPFLVAFEEEIAKNAEAACKFAIKIIGDKAAAKDIVADKLAKFWDKRAQYAAEDKLKRAYFFAAVRNACINYLERRVGRFKDLTDYTMPIEGGPNVAESRSEIHFLLKNLEPHHRRVVEMSYLQGMVLREIAEELEVSVSTIHNWLKEAITVLKKFNTED